MVRKKNSFSGSAVKPVFSIPLFTRISRGHAKPRRIIVFFNRIF